MFPLEGRYRLDDRIGADGMGEVWRATDLVLDRLVAVRLLDPGGASDEVGLARCRAEARHAGSLTHPGIARVYDYCEAEPPGRPYLVMELVDGPSLARVVDAGPLDPVRTMDLVARAARALEAAHAAGLVHRDIKPGYLLIDRSGNVKITDSGIAHAVGSAHITRPGALIGTPAYLSPERALGAAATPPPTCTRMASWPFQCLTGQLPFDGPPLAVHQPVSHLAAGDSPGTGRGAGPRHRRGRWRWRWSIRPGPPAGCRSPLAGRNCRPGRNPQPERNLDPECDLGPGWRRGASRGWLSGRDRHYRNGRPRDLSAAAGRLHIGRGRRARRVATPSPSSSSQ